jgi:ribonucleoside-diphosphate reductase alpha chain
VPDLHDLYGQSFENRYEAYESQNLPSARNIPATNLWRRLLTMLYETGHPWITFKDACNVRNPQSHVGVIHNSNLCTEITLNTSADETAVCNLGSVNLSKMVIGGKLNEKLIESTVKTAVRMLDNVIDVNFYPTVEAKTANGRHRPIGLGVMGYQDVLYQLKIPFASERNCDLSDELMELVSFYAISASNELARERGTYQSYPGSKWSQGLLPYDTLALLQEERGVSLDYSKQQIKDWNPLRESIKAFGMRNSNCMAIAPTATISNISGTTPCIEPSFRNIYVKENTDGTFIVVNEYMVNALEQLNLWNDAILNQIKLRNGSLASVAGVPEELKELYREAFEISPDWVVKSAARRAKWIDQSASTNIFIKTESGKILDQIYTLAWKLGLKTTYYLRSLSTSQVEKNIDSDILPGKGDSEPALCRIDDPTCEVCQ